jgi:hypothetical protein
MNLFLRFFSNENIPFALRSKQNKVINAWDTIYADQQFTENIYSGRVANLLENRPFFIKIIDKSCCNKDINISTELFHAKRTTARLC